MAASGPTPAMIAEQSAGAFEQATAQQALSVAEPTPNILRGGVT